MTRAAPSELFFSEYIEGTSNNKALEIYNGTGAPIDLAAGGYSIQMFFNGSTSAGLAINFTGTVAAGDVYVVAQSAASVAILAQADQTSGAGLFNGDDAVTLRKGTEVVDAIGQIGVDPGTEWGSGLTSTADNTLRRKSSIQAGDTNGTDVFDPSVEWDGYATDTFDGLGAHNVQAGDAAPSVSSTVPTDGASGVMTDANISVTFSEAVNVSGGWFAIDCSTSGVHAATASGGPTTFTLDPDTDFVNGDTCDVDVLASGVSDQDADDPPDGMSADASFAFTVGTVCVAATHLIHDIQGSGTGTPISGTTVTINGVVVGDYQGSSPTLRGFFVQEEDADADVDPLTSEGIFVFHSSTDVAPGDVVSVTGRATEFSSLTQIDQVANVTVCDSGASVTPAAITLPVGATGDWERWEGMLASFTQTMTVTENFSLG